jgi:tRNA(fMet)-specific endonuclease VapC
MTLKFLLDTSIISAPISKRPNRRVLRRLEQHAAHCAIAAPVWHELVYGFSRLPAGKRREALEEYLHGVVQRSFAVLPYDELAAESHGRERARLEAAGRTPPFVDGQIAAIAQSQGLTLVTANMEAFRHFDDLQLTDWNS